MTKTVLIVEDELFVALDIQDIVEAIGCDVDGPYQTVVEAMTAVERQQPDCAVLDVRLLDGEVFPAADRLRDDGVPLVFHSGHVDERDLKGRYPDALLCPKPAAPVDLRRVIERALAARS